MMRLGNITLTAAVLFGLVPMVKTASNQVMQPSREECKAYGLALVQRRDIVKFAYDFSTGLWLNPLRMSPEYATEAPPTDTWKAEFIRKHQKCILWDQQNVNMFNPERKYAD